ncbi:lopap-like [Ischnura elegans]|uniref:lopap-like n=1 Tax=Ischnura elegans TaxID=197161 RepID=UPI001ED8ACA2|nr:lopap-like [Ischnura elegans]
MAPSITIVTVLFSIATISRAQIYIPSEMRCPPAKAIQDFSEKDFMGTWYEVASSPILIETFAEDVSFKFTKGKSTTTVILDMKSSSEKTQFHGYMKPLLENNINGQYSLTFDKIVESKNGVSAYNFSADFMILKTDYKSYAAVWSCDIENVGGQNMAKYMAWILSRSRELDDTSFVEASMALSDVYAFPYQLKYTIQHSGTARHLASFICTIITIVILSAVS